MMKPRLPSSSNSCNHFKRFKMKSDTYIRTFRILRALSFLCTLTFTSQSHVSAARAVATSENCTSVLGPSLGCINATSFTVTYPAGELQCGATLTLGQSALEPTVTLHESSTDSDNIFYTVLLVDTGVSDFHPILHYGASNIPSDDFLHKPLNLSASSPFSSYRGPSPPAFLPGIQDVLFQNYEWIVAVQTGFVENEDLPVVEGNILFGIEDYLEGVSASMVGVSYFSSGFCVKEIEVMDQPKTKSKAKAKAKMKINKATKLPKKGKKTKKSWEYGGDWNMKFSAYRWSITTALSFPWFKSNTKELVVGFASDLVINYVRCTEVITLLFLFCKKVHREH